MLVAIYDPASLATYVFVQASFLLVEKSRVELVDARLAVQSVSTFEACRREDANAEHGQAQWLSWSRPAPLHLALCVCLEPRWWFGGLLCLVEKSPSLLPGP